MRTSFIPSSETHLSICEATFDEHYPLRVNHLNPHAGWAVDDGGGCLFETHGDELAFVCSQDPRCIWTLVDGGDSPDQYLLSGYHLVNRVGYLISTVPVAPGVAIEVHLPTESDPLTSTEQE
ncbi:hypothetical protein [Tuwongella immobilis]|uniref:Uncharacterized protein n=1 Tax=Tuwongella immobilis TaxID=692036 RepID=A0A6C2YWT0_9BACT|nr:hypothetical protein [Tuwongella immobilis]VIP05312.1 Uncharacterized protein OS=Blastopirellula marina DSM 3645 GN=DSM3645_28012 PE=4 SV=1 [Tuwongella immobilis]VTS07980.1 Uncharacterized protein OS=Blastopirellula marina DSM 3645 GN=DSM3645_28012 PE=4 SV=1 [Tuwongella immobilis]